MLDLTGKIAVVTGASSGIGEAVSRELSQAGVKVVLAARRTDWLEAVAASLPGESEIVPCDIGDPAAAVELLDRTQERFGTPDILVNNAAIMRTGLIDQFDIEAVELMTRCNFIGPVRASYIFARAMLESGSGTIINVSSIGAHLNVGGIGVYTGLKRALEGFSESLRMELAGSGVRVALIAPGTVTTDIFQDLKARGEKGWDEYIETALQPMDVARGIVFMLQQPRHINLARMHIYAAEDAV